MTENQTPFPRPEGERPRDYDYVIHADHTRLTGTVRAHLMTAAMGGLVPLLGMPGIDEQATSVRISLRGASTLPDWDVLAPRLMSSLEKCAWELALAAPLLPEGARIKAGACVDEAHAIMASVKGGAR